MNKTINLNDNISFVLTKRGAEIYNANNDSNKKAGDKVIMQLWVFMNLFGNYMRIGFNEVVIENNNIEICQKY